MLQLVINCQKGPSVCQCYLDLWEGCLSGIPSLQFLHILIWCTTPRRCCLQREMEEDAKSTNPIKYLLLRRDSNLSPHTTLCYSPFWYFAKIVLRDKNRTVRNLYPLMKIRDSVNSEFVSRCLFFSPRLFPLPILLQCAVFFLCPWPQAPTTPMPGITRIQHTLF